MAKIIGSHTPAQIKNLAINGALDFWQEKGSATTTINTASNTSQYAADMTLFASVGSTVKNYSIVRSTDVPSTAQSGFTAPYSQLFTMLTGIASPAATDFVQPFQYRMEGVDYVKIHGKYATFGFWVKASVAGTYSFAVTNNAATRSYVTSFLINGSNTWEFKSISIAMDTNASWVFTNTSSLIAIIGAVSGSNYQTSSLNQWQAGERYAASGATNWQATTNATLQVSMLSIVEGPLGLGATGFSRAGDTAQSEFAMCQRYYWRTVPGFSGISALSNGSTSIYYWSRPPVQMRAAPSLSGGTGTFAINIGGANFLSSSVTPGFTASDADGACIWSVNGWTGLTANAAYQSTPAGAPTGYLTADARL